MVERKSLSKKIRFEVFKRDKFTCQYCGQKAPDIVLQVDHIDPVAKGGDNDIINLITSCFDCNNGKRDKKLDDNSIVEKQRKQLELLQERREQIELMLEWKKSLSTFDSDIVDMIVDYTNSKIAPFALNDNGKQIASDWLKKFNVEKILDGIDEAGKKYIKYENGAINKESAEVFLNKVGGVIAVKEMPPVNQKLAYIKGIARNRFNYWDDKKGAITLNTYIPSCRNYGWDEEMILADLEKEVIPLTKNAKNWSDWKGTLDNWTNDINNWKNEEQKQLETAKELEIVDPRFCGFCYSDDSVTLHSLDFANSSSKPIMAICAECLQLEKENRTSEENNLIQQLRYRKFTHAYVSQIASAIENMNAFHIAEDIANVISWAIMDDGIMKILNEQYYKEMAEKRKKMEENIDDLPF